MTRRSIRIFPLVMCIAAAGCGSSGSSNHHGVAAMTAHSGSGDEPSIATASSDGGYGPVTAKQFADTQLCVEAADGGGDTGGVIADVNVAAKRAFDNGDAQVYLFDSRESASVAIRDVEQQGTQATALRQYGNVLVAYPTSEDGSQLGHVLPCILQVYSGQVFTFTTQSHPEKFFGSLREWANAHGYKWLPAFLSAPPGGSEGNQFTATLTLNREIPYLAVAGLLVPSDLGHITIVDTASHADALRLVKAYASIYSDAYSHAPTCQGYCPTDPNAPAHSTSTHVQEYPGAVAVNQFAIIPEDDFYNGHVIPEAKVRAVGAGLQDAPAVPQWFLKKVGESTSGSSGATSSSGRASSGRSAPVPPSADQGYTVPTQ